MTLLSFALIAGSAIIITIFSLINRTRSVSRDEIIKRNDELEKELERSQNKLREAENNLQIIENRFEDYQEISERQNQQQSEKIEILQQKVTNFAADISRLEAEKHSLEDRLQNHKQEIEELHKNSQLQFQNLANKLLEEKSSKFTEANKTNIEALLKPLGENIETFRKKVEEVYEKESRQKLSLEEQIKNLSQQSNKISAEANSLAQALKGQNKKQGNWGEIILETILQNSGLIKDLHYRREESFRNEEGKNLRPDFIITLPDDKLIIVDSKMSLNAYDKFCSSDDEIEQNLALKEHLASIYRHIDELSAKKYDDLEGALDFTIMFIPIEPAYLTAIQSDSELWFYAYNKRILLTSPTNFIACLRLISELWRHDDQHKNHQKILQKAGSLYDKFVTFTESLKKIGKHIGDAQNAYDTAFNQLEYGRGNLISKAEELKKLGVKTKKKLEDVGVEGEILADEEEN